jgi:hypothetical protein
MTDEINQLKRKVAELEARQQTQAPSKPNPGGVPALMRLIAAIVVVMITIAALSNVNMTGSSTVNKTTPRVSTAADVVAYQKKAREAKRLSG